jgi:ankyrin repeat protein
MSTDIDVIVNLYWAGKNREVIEAARAHPSLLKCKDEYGETLLNNAIARGDVEMVDSLLRLGASPNSVDLMATTPLITAVQSKSPLTTEILRLLIQSGADVNAKSYSGNSALFAAIVEDSTEIVEFLLKNGANIDIRGIEDAETPLWSAALWGNDKMVRLLLEHGADPYLKDATTGRTPLEMARTHAAKSQPHRNIVSILEVKMAQTRKGERNSPP